jgi:hypothetical protein
MTSRPHPALAYRQDYSDLDRALLEALCRGTRETIRPLLDRFRHRAMLRRVDAATLAVVTEEMSPSVPAK